MSNLSIARLTPPTNYSAGRPEPASPADRSTSQAPAREAVSDKSAVSAAQGTAPAQLPWVDGVTALQPASSSQVKAAIQNAIEQSFARVPDRPGENRHQLNARLQADAGAGAKGARPHYNGADIIVIAFEGTGAFEPRQAPVMQATVEILRQQGLGLSGTASALNYLVDQALDSKTGQTGKWSGLAAGPLESLLNDDALAAQTQWFSFASEEFEVLAGDNPTEQLAPRQLLAEIQGSLSGQTPGISQALKAVQALREQAQAQGKTPRFVIVSHSSGGRSAVKFMEQAKALPAINGQAFNSPLLFSIDPVREAHEALGEALSDVYLRAGTQHNLNRLRGLLGWAPAPVKHPAVQSQPQPESLYKPGNAQKAINFYQRQDREGLKMDAVRFGIHGSPLARGENIEIKGVGSAGHGEIAYQQQVTNRFLAELRKLTPGP
ncbi:MAG: hypothetical protein IGS03_11040 [Candidatus Sericytochromatia bacterium]|nr:hypothetical protein [Candidatus Sericytochromatia bacterium]